MLGPGLFWGWGWLAGVAAIILLGIFLLPWFFFLLNLQNLLTNVSPPNRRMNPGLVWLNFIPVFHLGWFVYTVVKVKDSVHAEFRTLGWYVDGDLGYNVGLTAGILWIASFFIGWIPFIGWVLPLAGVVCWVIYWLKMSDLKNRLDSGPAWSRPGPYPFVHPPVYPPAARYPQGQAPPPGADAPQAGAGAPSPGGSARGPGGSAGPEPAGDAPDETVSRQRRCAACGAPYDEGDGFCRRCGYRLS